MDTNTTILLGLLIFAAIIIVVLRFRQGISAQIKTLLGEMKVTGSNPTPAPRAPGSATVEKAEAGGNINAAARTGGDASVRQAKAKGDISATTDDPSPKA